jgi:hypothetical protein
LFGLLASFELAGIFGNEVGVRLGRAKYIPQRRLNISTG